MKANPIFVISSLINFDDESKCEKHQYNVYIMITVLFIKYSNSLYFQGRYHLRKTNYKNYFKTTFSVKYRKLVGLDT